METKDINDNTISLFLIINILQYHFFIIFIQSHQIGNQPACIKARPVELGEFEVPLIYLEKVELHIRHGFKLDIPLLDLIEKQGKEIRGEVLGGVRFWFLVILKRFAQVHKTQFVAQGMKKLLLVAFCLVKRCFKSFKGNLVNYPLEAQSLRLKFHK